jgi:hypothetical protein
MLAAEYKTRDTRIQTVNRVSSPAAVATMIRIVTSQADARQLLGLGDDADADAVRAARRRLAKALHPDVGGSAEAMQELNEATAIVLNALDEPAASAATATPSFRSQWKSRPSGGFRQHVKVPVAHDVASFVIEALPVEAFEALLVATSWIGEVISDEPPYQLDVLMTDPIRCWCRLDLVPDAGASTVSLTIARLPDEPDLPDIDDVRDLWVQCLNDVGRSEE